MRDLNKMTAEDFSDLADRNFLITSPQPQLAIELIEVRKLGAGEREGGAFSLLWQGPKEPYLAQ